MDTLHHTTQGLRQFVAAAVSQAEHGNVTNRRVAHQLLDQELLRRVGGLLSPLLAGH
jgi:hypothetical protein